MSDLAHLIIIPTINPHVANLDAKFGKITLSIGTLRIRHDTSRHMGKSFVSLSLYKTIRDPVAVQAVNDEWPVGKFTWVVIGAETDNCSVRFAPNLEFCCKSVMKQIIMKCRIHDVDVCGHDLENECNLAFKLAFKVWVLDSMIHTDMEDFRDKSVPDIAVDQEIESLDKSKVGGMLKFGISRENNFECGYLYASNVERGLDKENARFFPDLYEQGSAIAVDTRIETSQISHADTVVVDIRMHHASKGIIHTIRVTIDPNKRFKNQVCDAFLKTLEDAYNGKNNELRKYLPVADHTLTGIVGGAFWRWLKDYSPVSVMVKVIDAMQISQ